MDTKILYNGRKCPECNDSGYVLIEESTPESEIVYGDKRKVPIAAKCSRCNGGQQARAKEIHSRAEIPQSFYDKRMNDFDWNIYHDSVGKQIDTSLLKRFVDSFIYEFEEWEKQGLGLYIWSHMRGSGKTFLASCICNELIYKYSISTKFVSANKLIDIAKAGNSNEKNYDPIEMLCRCKVLVIDDLGQNTSGNNWVNDILFRITDSRLQAKHITIVTSNIKLSDLDIDDRVVDRLYKICQPIPLPEFAARQKEASFERVQFFKKLGLDKRNTNLKP